MKAALDPARLAQERAAVLDLEYLLRSSGDDPGVVRAIDLRFVGRPSAIAALRGGAKALGYEAVKLFEHDGGAAALELRLRQTTDPVALDAIVCWAVAAEAAYAVRYAGLTTCSQRAATAADMPAGRPRALDEAAVEAGNQDQIC